MALKLVQGKQININLTGSFSGSFSGTFSGSGANLYNIPASGIVGLNLSQISSGSVSASISEQGGLQVNTNVTATSFTGSLQGTAATASYAPSYLPLTGGTINGNVTVNGTASIAFLNVQYESASVIYSSGSNVFGDATNDTQTLVGTVLVSGSQTITGSLNVSQGITGSLFGTASYAGNAATASNILGGKATHIPFFATDTTLATSSLFQSGSTSIIINQDNNTLDNPEALYVWQPHPTSINVISGKGDLDNYLQLNIQNTSIGSNASSDIVATANNGSEADNYIDMGINSQYFNGFLGGPNDSYLYSQGHNMWIGNINDGYELNFFNSSSLQPIITLTSQGQANITGSLYGTASWALNAVQADNATQATSASHAVQADNAAVATYANTAGNGGVTNIVAGSGINLPFGGSGTVTIVAAAGTGEVLVISGSNVTQSFANESTWTFNHNLGVRTPIIEVFDTNYNQVIPQNIQLVSTSSATITFPTQESGFAVASVGGVTGNAVSSSYSLFSTYATTASYFVETDPIFAAKSGSYATTGSNRFIGNQTITGSLIVSGSNTFTNIGPAAFNGNTAVSGSLTITGSNTLIGTKTITGSVFITGSKTIIGTNTITGSFNVSGSTLQTGNNTLIGNTVLSGSISVSGSQTFVGAQYLTGSFLVSGSTTQIGNNTLTGNTLLTGSIIVSGSQTFIGNSTLTGSFSVTGSTLQTGNNTLIGNTVLSGSLEVSGSQTFRGTNRLVGNTTISGSFTVSGSTLNTIIGNTEVVGAFDVTGSSTFRNSTFTVTGSQFFTGSSFLNGSQTITGNQIISGTLDVVGNINVISGSSFTRWGNKLFNYGAFSDYTTQSGSADTAHAITFNTTDVALEVALSGSSAIKVLNKGIYNFQWSGQLNQGANASVVSIWLRINGTDVPGSRGDVSLSSNDNALPAWNYVLPFNANDAVELYWSSTSANTRWIFSPVATAPPRPSTASIIATLTQIA